MDENTWTASTSTSWISFSPDSYVSFTAGTGGDQINIYIKEATEPTTDVEGTITIFANGTTFTKTIKRCSPSISNTSKTIDFEIYIQSGGDIVGPCENGTGNNDSYGVRIRNIKLTTIETYSNGQSKTTEQTLSDSDVNIWYILPDGSKYSTLPSNTEQDRLVSVRVELKSNTSVFALKQNAFTQLGIKNGDGTYIESRLHNVDYSSKSTEYRNFSFAQSCIDQSSTSCHEGTFAYSITGQKVTIYGGKTGLTECNELVNIGGGTESPADIPTSEVTFNVTPTEYGSFNGNVLSYVKNESRSQGRELNVSATLNGTNTIHTTFTVIAGNDCGSPLYIIFKCVIATGKDYIDFTGGTATFKYYLANAEGASESEAITDQTLNGCLQFFPPQGVTSGNSLYSNGVYSVDVTFTQNTYMNGEEGKTWEFKATCPDAVNDPQIIPLYQANMYEHIIPNCDYFIFHYDWTEADGIDLDSLTHLSSCSELSGKTVGYNGTSANAVEGRDGKLYIKWGGDNRCNGSEYTIICLKNIVDDFKNKKVSFIDNIMLVDIYANWFTSKSAGNMKVVYNQYSGLTSGGYDEEIVEVEHINDCIYDKPKYYSFKPKEGACISIAESASTRNIVVSAAGGNTAARLAKEVDCIGNVYSHVLRVSYNFAAQKTSFQYVNDEAINVSNMTEKTVVNGVDYTKADFTASTGAEVSVTYSNVYWKHEINGTVNKAYPFESDNDYFYCRAVESNESLYYYKSDIGTEKDLGFIKKLKITKNSDGSINISFKMEATTTDVPEHHFYITPHIEVGYIYPCKTLFLFSDIDVYQKNR